MSPTVLEKRAGPRAGSAANGGPPGHRIDSGWRVARQASWLAGFLAAGPHSAPVFGVVHAGFLDASRGLPQFDAGDCGRERWRRGPSIFQRYRPRTAPGPPCRQGWRTRAEMPVGEGVTPRERVSPAGSEPNAGRRVLPGRQARQVLEVCSLKE